MGSSEAGHFSRFSIYFLICSRLEMATDVARVVQLFFYWKQIPNDENYRLKQYSNTSSPATARKNRAYYISR
jgi:hypothetical protein